MILNFIFPITAMDRDMEAVKSALKRIPNITILSNDIGMDKRDMVIIVNESDEKINNNDILVLGSIIGSVLMKSINT